MKNTIFHPLKHPLGVVLIALLAACATGPKGPPEEVVRTPCRRPWLSLQFGKFDMAYETPRLPTGPRQTTKCIRFGPGMQWTGSEVVSIEMCRRRSAMCACASMPGRPCRTCMTVSSAPPSTRSGCWKAASGGFPSIPSQFVYLRDDLPGSKQEILCCNWATYAYLRNVEGGLA